MSETKDQPAELSVLSKATRQKWVEILLSHPNPRESRNWTEIADESL
jgi:hypothetical protein